MPNLLDGARLRASLSSDYALAKRIRVRESTVSRWRSGTRLPSYRHCVALALLAGVPADEVVNAVEALRDRGRGKKLWQTVGKTVVHDLPAQSRLPFKR